MLNHLENALQSLGIADPPVAQSHTETPRAAKASPLLRLPAELRNRIYDLVYPSTSAARDGEKKHDFPTILIAHIDQQRLLSNHTFRKHIALTQTCRQLRTETRPSAFAGRHFAINAWPHHARPKAEYWHTTSPTKMVARYLEVLGPEPLSLMGSLQFVERGSNKVTCTFTKDFAWGCDVIQLKYSDVLASKYWYNGTDRQERLRERLGGCGEVFEAAGFEVEWYVEEERERHPWEALSNVMRNAGFR